MSRWRCKNLCNNWIMISALTFTATPMKNVMIRGAVFEKPHRACAYGREYAGSWSSALAQLRNCPTDIQGLRNEWPWPVERGTGGAMLMACCSQAKWCRPDGIPTSTYSVLSGCQQRAHKTQQVRRSQQLSQNEWSSGTDRLLLSVIHPHASDQQ